MSLIRLTAAVVLLVLSSVVDIQIPGKRGSGGNGKTRVSISIAMLDEVIDMNIVIARFTSLNQLRLKFSIIFIAHCDVCMFL